MQSGDDIFGGNETLRPEGGIAPSPDTEPDQLIGMTLDERYQIEQRLGQGGFGAVYLAADLKVAPRKVVVKVVHQDETANEWSMKKFQQEFEALARIKHPSFVDVFDCGKTPDERPYIVMQYIEGVSLRSLLVPEGMPFGRAANIVRQTGKALNAAHEAGILHRDLKPENIMVQSQDDEELVKLIDFGIAKVKNSTINVTTAKAVAVGTIAYMSPEQLSAKPLTPESDVYALGVIAFEMLTGRHPTNPKSAFELLDLQRAGIRLRPTELRPGLPVMAEEVVLKALEFEPTNRYQRARDFGDLLASSLTDDDEQTLLQTKTKIRVEVPEKSPLETAHVLFVDIVGYSRLLIDEQTAQLQELQSIVLQTKECLRASTAQELIRLPTGDGMALVFFKDPEAPVRCAVEISRVLKTNSTIQLRMGLHSGFVYRMADVNTNMNVAGGGINLAQRVMDCGDSGHILVSQRVADDLGQLARWSGHLRDLGVTEVKHGIQVHVFNLFGDDFGNSERPQKFSPVGVKPFYQTKRALIAGTVLLAVTFGSAMVWYVLKSRTAPTTAASSSPTANPVPAGPERTLTYWLTIQKMLNNRPLGDPIQSAGDISFGNGWRFQLNLEASQTGALYLLNAGPGKNNLEEFNILFPLPGKGTDGPMLVAERQIKSDWYRFVDQTGIEKIWIIWSTTQLPDLDSIFSSAAANEKDPGVINGSEEIAKLRNYLKMYESAKPEVVSDKARKVTSIKGRGAIIVSLVELSHEAY